MDFTCGQKAEHRDIAAEAGGEKSRHCCRGQSHPPLPARGREAAKKQSEAKSFIAEAQKISG
ncbi:hypothetical protein ACTUSQ_24325 [Pantoea ananatis]